MINVPTRGIGKGVMDALEQVDIGGGAEDLPPLLRRPRSRRRLELAVVEAGDRIEQRLLNPARSRRSRRSAI